MLLRAVYVFAGVFLIGNAIYITQHMARRGDFFLLAAVSPALIAALALGMILILRNTRKAPEEPPTDPEGGSGA